jgi:hypothetical protein
MAAILAICYTYLFRLYFYLKNYTNTLVDDMVSERFYVCATFYLFLILILNLNLNLIEHTHTHMTSFAFYDSSSGSPSGSPSGSLSGSPSPPPFTVVSAFMTQINSRHDRNVQKYILLGHSLLQLGVRQILFVERSVFAEHFDTPYRHLSNLNGCDGTNCVAPIPIPIPMQTFMYRSQAYEYVVYGHLTFVLFEKTDLYLTAYRECATEFSLNTQHPQKDTLDYMFVQCHKTEWLAMAIALDTGMFGTSNLRGMYAWFDFGIRHMYPSDTAFAVAIYQLQDRIVEHCVASAGNGGESKWNRLKIYAPGCWDSRHKLGDDVYRSVYWIFSGTAIGGSAGAVTEFARLTREKCIWLLTTKKHLMWEVNVWALIQKDCPQLFALFYGNHNRTLLEKWFA